jgi:hypothetical protein
MANTCPSSPMGTGLSTGSEQDVIKKRTTNQFKRMERTLGLDGIEWFFSKLRESKQILELRFQKRLFFGAKVTRTHTISDFAYKWHNNVVPSACYMCIILLKFDL